MANSTKLVMILRISLFFAITVLLTFILGFGQEQLKINYERIAIPQIAPALAFLIMALLFKALKVPINVKFDRLIFFRLLLALFIPFALLLFGFYIGILLNYNFEHTTNILTTLPIAILGMILGSIGEEIGWRGFLQAYAETQYSKIPSAIIVGIFWGLWHVGNYQYGIIYMMGFLLFIISASIILRILLDETQNNLLISVLFHLSINIGFFTFFKNALTNDNMIWVNGIIWHLTALTMLVIAYVKIKKQKYYEKNDFISDIRGTNRSCPRTGISAICRQRTN